MITGNMKEEAYLQGIKWLIDIQDPVDECWGFYKDAPCHTLPTALAVRAIGEALRSRSLSDSTKAKRALRGGVAWLKSTVNVQSGGWGNVPESTPTLGHTAMAIMSLSSSGEPGVQNIIRTAVDWMLDTSVSELEKMEKIKGTHDTYEVPTRRIHHVTFTPAVVVQASMRSGVSLSDNRLSYVVQHLLDLQERSGDHAGAWYVDGVPSDKKFPIFGIMDANVALRLYMDRLEKDRPFVLLSRRIDNIEQKMQAMEERLDHLHGSMYKIEQNMLDITNTLNAMNNRISFIAAPIEFVRRHRKILALVVLNIVVFLASVMASVRTNDWRILLIATIIAALGNLGIIVIQN